MTPSAPPRGGERLLALVSKTVYKLTYVTDIHRITGVWCTSGMHVSLRDRIIMQVVQTENKSFSIYIKAICKFRPGVSMLNMAGIGVCID